MKVVDLPLPLLNYWIARALDLPVDRDGDNLRWTGSVPDEFAAMVKWETDTGRPLDFIGDLALGHAVIEWIWISIERPSQGQTVPTWRAVTDWRGSQKPHEFQGPVSAFGPSGIIAAMRALVMATFGERVPKS